MIAIAALKRVSGRLRGLLGGRENNPGEAPEAKNLLVVDDEAVVREFLRRCLEATGYPVKQAPDADEALEIMNNTPAAVVVCDIRLPGRDGLWLAEQLRAKWPRTAIVMATAVDDRETVSKSLALGAVDYLTKPISAEHLLHVVNRAMRARIERAAIERVALDRAFADAMGAIARQNPSDADAAAIYAESLLDLSPWNYWQDDGSPRDFTNDDGVELSLRVGVVSADLGAGSHPLPGCVAGGEATWLNNTSTSFGDASAG